MAKYTSGRQRNLKVGIQSYSENLTSLEVIGKVGIGTTNAFANLQVDGTVILGAKRSDLINIPGSFSSHLYPDGDGVYDIGRAPEIGLGANRWRNANFTGKGVFDSGVDAHNLELGVGAPNLIYSTSGNLELNAQSGTTNIDDIVTISGNLGVGTDNPTSKLWVNGDGYFTGVVTASSFRGDGSQLSGISVPSAVSISTNTTNANQLIPYAVSFGSTTGLGATTEFVYNPSTGNFGIGTANPTVKLDVNGDVNISGILTATDINSSSDIRLKKNIKKFENTLEKIDEINGVSFEWKQSGSKSAGIIAQELEKVFPELVIDSGDYKKVNYNGLIGVLVESIKELKEEVKELKQRLDQF